MHHVLTRSRAIARSTIACALLAAAASVVPAAWGQAAVACGPATAATIAATDAMIANNINRNELDGSETQTDLARVEHDPVLLAALADSDTPTAAKAVAQIVYHHYWHIVRLRVLDDNGRVIADVGGPHVIAPVTGVLRSAAGTELGTFVMSVQDDVGFTKLEMRGVGDPIGIYSAGRLVAQLGGSFPSSQPAGTAVTLAGVRYLAETLIYMAFPSGALAAVIAVPAPSAALRSETCAAVGVAEIARVAERLSLRFHPLAASYGSYVEVVHTETGAQVIVRIGLRVIAGQGPGPLTMPSGGTVTYEGRTWSVFTFAPTPPATVYLLIPSRA
jgi:hypothetical protein